MNMYAQNTSATIVPQERNQDFTYENTLVLSMVNQYPKVLLPGGGPVETAINSRILMQVDEEVRYSSTTLFDQAVETYQEAQQQGFPFNPYGSGLYYRTMFNQDCYLSIYRDQFLYTGGAHPTTTRFSDTWDMRTGMVVPLSSFFPSQTDYQQLLLRIILAEADRRQEEEAIFFDDYRTLIAQRFNPESYYLSPCGLTIYYQQYDIAPYAAGIIEFTIPFSVLRRRPSCTN
jgi:hypothetical protein